MSHTNFYDDIPLMINRACRLHGITQKELGKRIGYGPESMARLNNGDNIEGMSLGKLMVLMELAECEYEWRRRQ